MSTKPSSVSDESGYLPWAVDPGEVPDEIREVVLGSRERPDHGTVLTVVLFTDIVGSTEIASELGDRRWRDLLEAHNALVRRELMRYGGREVDTAGDGFVATFGVPSSAIDCARASAEAVRWIGLDLRAGIHAGECEIVGSKPGGLTMNIGARVAAMAQPGEVLVSETIRQLLIGSGLEFADRGRHELRGVPGEWGLFSVAA
jgi:class 3 adenylate cyclase